MDQIEQLRAQLAQTQAQLEEVRARGSYHANQAHLLREHQAVAAAAAYTPQAMGQESSVDDWFSALTAPTLQQQAPEAAPEAPTRKAKAITLTEEQLARLQQEAIRTAQQATLQTLNQVSAQQQRNAQITQTLQQRLVTEKPELARIGGEVLQSTWELVRQANPNATPDELYTATVTRAEQIVNSVKRALPSPYSTGGAQGDLALGMRAAQNAGGGAYQDPTNIESLFAKVEGHLDPNFAIDRTNRNRVRRSKAFDTPAPVLIPRVEVQ